MFGVGHADIAGSRTPPPIDVDPATIQLILMDINSTITRRSESVPRVNWNVNWRIFVGDVVPVLDGYETTARLKAGGLRIPIIALTACAMQSELDKARAC